MRTKSRLWVVVLAGGDGRRLAAATTDRHGTHVPKQFCRFGASTSILHHALDRAARMAEPERTLAVVQETHRRWWEPELRDLPDGNVIAQPGNRGTAVALLHALCTILQRDPEAFVLVLPSDQEVEDELTWYTTLRHAAGSALGLPHHVVLVGVEPQPDPDFGWIVPGEPAEHGTRAVLGFVEKPSATEAARLALRGALCSTFTFAASAAALLEIYHRHPSARIARFARALGDSALAPGVGAAESEDLPASDFSHDLFERAPQLVRVITGNSCGWTDLGTPERLARWLERRQLAAEGPAPAIATRAGPSGGSRTAVRCRPRRVRATQGSHPIDEDMPIH